jgi:hypothetical protein
MRRYRRSRRLALPNPSDTLTEPEPFAASGEKERAAPSQAPLEISHDSIEPEHRPRVRLLGPNVSGGLVISDIEQRTSWDID